MEKRLLLLGLFAVLLGYAAADMYLHSPRGSNNRLDGMFFVGEDFLSLSTNPNYISICS